MVRVLVVSNSSVTRALLASLLRADRYTIDIPDSLPSALARIPSAPPAVAIVQSDVVRSSPDAIDRIRAAAKSSVPIVLIDRAYADDRRGADEVRAFGATLHLALPPDRAALDDALRRATEQPAVGKTVPPSGGQEEDAAAAFGQEQEQKSRFVDRLWSNLDALDAYQLLRVSPSASDREIQSAFRQRALEFHPDRQREVADEETRERVYQIFKRISRAFRDIGDPVSRKRYDAQHPR
jgi:CheY-like chemotaxis protein